MRCTLLASWSVSVSGDIEWGYKRNLNATEWAVARVEQHSIYLDEFTNYAHALHRSGEDSHEDGHLWKHSPKRAASQQW